MNLFARDITSNLIYIDNDNIKIVCLDPGAGLNAIRAVYVKEITGMDDEHVAEEIHKGWQTVSAEGNAAEVILTSKYAITKTVEVPSFDEDEIAAIVKLQASQHTPYSKNEIISDHISLEQVKGRHTRALLAIFSQSNVQKHLNIVREAGIEIRNVRADFDCVAAGLNKSLMVNPSDVAAVIIVDSAKTDYIVVNDEKPLFVRCISFGMKHSMDETKFKNLITEIEKSNESYQSTEPDRRITKVLVLGPSSAIIEKLAKSVSDKFNMNTQVAHAVDHVEMSQQASQFVAENRDASFDHVLLGGAGAGSYRLDVTPSDIKAQHEFRQRAQRFIRVGASVFSIFVIFLVAMFTKIYFAHAYLNALQTGFSDKDAEASQLSMISEQNRLIREFASTKGVSIRAIQKLESILPEQMILNELNIDKEGKVTLKGTSTLMSRVFAFSTEFENTDGFTSVKTDYAKSRKVDGIDVTDFGLSAAFEAK